MSSIGHKIQKVRKESKRYKKYEKSPYRRKDINMKALQEALEKLRQTGSIGLEDFKKLKMRDVERLTEEIKQWCLYGNGKPEELGMKHVEH